MKANKLFTILCILTTICLLVTTWGAHWATDFGIDALRFIALIIASALFFIAIARVVKRASLPFRERVFPLCIWLALAAIAAAYDTWQNRLDRMPNFLTIVGNDDSHFSRFEFKKNGYYKFGNGFLGPDSLSYGTYVRHDSLIILTPESARNRPSSLKLLIRPYSMSATPAFNSTSGVRNIHKGDTTSYRADFHIAELNYN